MAAASDTGSVRQENEDYYYFSKSRKFFIVCDGMGGHQRGDWASKIAGETIRDLLFGSETVRSIVIGNKAFDLAQACRDISEELTSPALKLLAGIRLANRRIFSNATKRDPMQGMGTTVSVALFHEGHAFIAHVGDSRVYRLRDGKLSCMTSDHSWVNELIEDNEIDEKQAEAFEKKNVLTRALGLMPSVKIDLRIEPVQPNDLYLLCSDGLHNALKHDLMQSILCAYHGSLQNKISNLVNSARLMDGSDNITGGLVQLNGDWKTPEKAIQKKYTISEEPRRVISYLDDSIKNIYSKKVSSRRINRKAVAIIGALLSLFLVVVLFIFQPGQAQKDSPDENYALVFLKGDFHAPQYDGAQLFINDKKWGGLDQYETNGLHLNNGNYTISIRDDSNRVLSKKSNVRISNGESIVVEF